MYRTIYIDSVFIINFVMDLLLLKLCVKTLKKTATGLRIFAASLTGAAGYCLALCIPGISYAGKILIFMIPVGMLTIKISARTQGWKELLYGTGYLFSYSFLVGGFMIFLMGKIPWLKNHKDSVMILLGMGYLGYEICKAGIDKYRRQKENHFCHVEIKSEEGLLVVSALIDTGNGLTDPLSGKPVAILEEEKWGTVKQWMKPEKYKVIPFHSIGKSNGILEGYEVESIRVTGEMGKKQFDNVIIAVFKGKLSAKGEYQMILPSELSI